MLISYYDTTGNVVKLEVTRIGSGGEGTAYRYGDSVYFFATRKYDTRKFLLSLVGLSKHFVDIKYVGESDVYNVYKMPYMLTCGDNADKIPKRIEYLARHINKIAKSSSEQAILLERIKRSKVIPKSLKKAFDIMLEQLKITKDTYLDLCVFNFSYHDKRLIIRDPVYHYKYS